MAGCMGPIVGAGIDLAHAVFMAAWVLGLPLLFWRRWPRLTQAYAIYAIVFVVVNQLSEVFLGECVLTTLARLFWERSPGGWDSSAAGEWFTVRIAETVFRLSPSHHAIKRVSEWLIFFTAVGVTLRCFARRHEARAPGRRSPGVPQDCPSESVDGAYRRPARGVRPR